MNHLMAFRFCAFIFVGLKLYGFHLKEIYFQRLLGVLYTFNQSVKVIWNLLWLIFELMAHADRQSPTKCQISGQLLQVSFSGHELFSKSRPAYIG